MLNRTSEFRESVEEKKKALFEGKSRKLPRRPLADHDSEQNALLTSKEYVHEAYKIFNHITTLSRMLSSIRRPYLNVDSSGSLFRQPSRALDLGGSDEQWSGIRHLSNEERDQIDLQARVVLSRCADRVKEMELLEQRRAEIAAKRTNPILRLLPSRLRQDTLSSSDFLAAHHSSITWFLNRRLAEASQNQKEMQEERIRRQSERARTLGSGAAKEAVDLCVRDPLSMDHSHNAANHGTWLGGIGGTSGLASSLASSLTGSNASHDSSQSSTSRRQLSHQTIPDEDMGLSDDDADALELSPSQILQFETENANILRSVQDTLASVQLAESRLLDISALQMELVTHLTRQTEVTEQLHEDATATSSMVDGGNVQLREARRRAKDGRMFILLFLFGASLALLFVHLY